MLYPTKMSFLVHCLLILIISTVLISGNVIPISDETLPGPQRWIPTSNQRHHYYPSTKLSESVQSYSAYHRDTPSPNVILKNIKYGQSPTVRHPTTERTGPIAPLPEPKPRRDDNFEEKLGFSMLSSLLPTSILNSPQQQDSQHTENLIEEQHTDSSSHNSLFDNFNPQQLRQQLRQHLQKLQGQNNNDNNNDMSYGYGYGPSSSSSEQLAPNPDNSQEEDSDSGNGLFTRIRNIIPFGSGLLSGFLNGEHNNADGEGATTGSGDNENNSPDPSYNSPFANNELSHGESNTGSLFSFNPSQTGATNQGTEIEANESTETGSGTSFLSSLPTLPNPFTSVKNLFNSFNSSPDADENTQLSESGGGYVDGPADPTDSSLTPLQSLADGGFTGVLGLVIPYLSHVLTALGPAKAKLPLIKLLGAVFVPILATAIAAMVIGIVYVSIYVSANAIKNEDVEGEIYLLSLKQLMDILGIPDPLEELFDIKIMRSLQERSMKSRSMKNVNSQEVSMSVGNSTSQDETCMERLACHAIGKKLIGSRSSWKDGWFGKGVRWISGNANLDNWNIARNNDFYYNLIQKGKLLIDAIVVGMEPQILNEKENIVHDNTTLAAVPLPSVCDRYTCEPILFLRNIVKPT